MSVIRLQAVLPILHQHSKTDVTAINILLTIRYHSILLHKSEHAVRYTPIFLSRVSDRERVLVWLGLPGSAALLDAALQKDRRRLPALLQWVRYTGLAAIQLEALQLTHLLAARMPAIVDLLLQAPRNGDASCACVFGFVIWLLRPCDILILAEGAVT